MRGGALGFVYADGHTESPQVRVEPAIFKAAKSVADGEIVAVPVREGERFSVVWRRGSIAAVDRPLEQERPAIEQVLLRQKVKKAFDELLERLTKQHVHEIHPELLKELPQADTRATAAQIGKPRGGPARSANPVPRPGPAGNR
jgi:peptidyl-prolyl cis-trans isomerase C